MQILPATVNRDCAPWDGPAFSLSIPYDPVSVIEISIWQSPDIRSPIWFSFPDRTNRVGDAFLLQPAAPPEEMKGSVHFKNVEQGIPLEGEFSFTTESGRQFHGKFISNWTNEIVACG